jgi:hypothetical protein
MAEARPRAAEAPAQRGRIFSEILRILACIFALRILDTGKKTAYT